MTINSANIQIARYVMCYSVIYLCNKIVPLIKNTKVILERKIKTLFFFWLLQCTEYVRFFSTFTIRQLCYHIHVLSSIIRNALLRVVSERQKKRVMEGKGMKEKKERSKSKSCIEREDG